jgi:hypothetical protein
LGGEEGRARRPRKAAVDSRTLLSREGCGDLGSRHREDNAPGVRAAEAWSVGRRERRPAAARAAASGVGAFGWSGRRAVAGGGGGGRGRSTLSA